MTRPAAKPRGPPRTPAVSACAPSLVVAQVAVSVALLISAGLLIRALWRVQSVNPGFVTADVLAIQTPVPWPRYAPTARRVDFYNRVLSETRSASRRHERRLHQLRADGDGRRHLADCDSRCAGDAGRHRAVAAPRSLRFVTPDFFATLGIPLPARQRRARVRHARPPRWWPLSASRSCAVTGPTATPSAARSRMATKERTVVGVVGDIRVRGLERPSEPQVYLPYRQVEDGWFPFYAPKELVVRASSDPAAPHARDPPHRPRGRSRSPAGPCPHASPTSSRRRPRPE